MGPFIHSGGRLNAVNDLDSALAALEEIVEQGEGTARGEVWDSDLDIFHPMQPNPRLDDHDPGSPIRIAQEAFNRAYGDLLRQLEQEFNGDPKTLGAAIGAMYGLKAKARRLMEMPAGEGTTAGPTFEYVTPELRR